LGEQMSENVDKLIELATDIVAKEKDAGADVAEVVASEGANLSARVRKAEPELVEEAAPRAIGMRVIVGGKSASVSTTDTTAKGIENLVADAIEIAQLSQPDPFNEPPDAALLAKEVPNLDLFDPSGRTLDAKAAIARAIAGEKAALELDERITNSEGATFSRATGARAMVTSGGFSGGYASSSYSLVVNPIGSQGDEKMQTGYHWDSKRHLCDLAAAEEIGAEAARRTLAKLGAQKVPSCEVPVVFDPDAGRALLSLLFSCVNGHAIYRTQSYLCGREGDTIGSKLVTIVDDPLLARGPGSRPFDGEGLPSRKNVVVDGGVLKTYLLDTYSGRKLERASTGSAARGGGAPTVGPSNFHLLPGDESPQSILDEVDEGLYVTGMMGFGFNAVTGDFSRGAEGFWVEKGKKVRPVGEITISLNFNELWKNIDAIGDDLIPKASMATPTFRVSKMTVAGT